jgi:hypothetical protein
VKKRATSFERQVSAMKNLGQVIAMVMTASAIPGAVAAESGAITNPLCEITNTLTCGIGGCVHGPASAVNLPVFVRIDTENNVIETAGESGERRTSKISSMRTEGDTLVLLGGELKRGWSATFNRKSAGFTGTVAEDGVGYIIFGSCITH